MTATGEALALAVVNAAAMRLERERDEAVAALDESEHIRRQIAKALASSETWAGNYREQMETAREDRDIIEHKLDEALTRQQELAAELEEVNRRLSDLGCLEQGVKQVDR